jgi:rieske iron-sulfur protein
VRGNREDVRAPCGACEADAERGSARRAFLRGAVAIGASLSLSPSAFAADDKPGAAGTASDATSLRAQLGDHFVFALGDKQGEVKVDDLPVGGPQVVAFPMDPKSGLVRDGSPLNMVILIRYNASDLSEETRAHAADGVVCYTAVCTHQGCPVSMWSTERKAVFCSCHGSIYDLKDGAQVLDGPAPRPLPALPLKIENAAPAVAGSFTGRVGSQI